MCLLPPTLRVENRYSWNIVDDEIVLNDTLRGILRFHQILNKDVDSYRSRITTIMRHIVSLFFCIIELIKELYFINFEDSDKWRAAHEGF